MWLCVDVGVVGCLGAFYSLFEQKQNFLVNPLVVIHIVIYVYFYLHIVMKHGIHSLQEIGIIVISILHA